MAQADNDSKPNEKKVPHQNQWVKVGSKNRRLGVSGHFLGFLRYVEQKSIV